VIEESSIEFDLQFDQPATVPTLALQIGIPYEELQVNSTSSMGWELGSRATGGAPAIWLLA
jgi:hypothetical protein